MPKSFTFSADSHESGPEPDEPEVKVREGDEFAIAGIHEGEGFIVCQLWHEGRVYSECPDWCFEVSSAASCPTDAEDVPQMDIGGYHDEDDGWWIEVEGPETTGWLNTEREELDLEIVSRYE